MATLTENIVNKFANSTIGKTITQGYSAAIGTEEGGEFIPEYTKTDGQKRYQTTSPIPNMPRPKTMFFVYFNINAKAQSLIEKKKNMMEYLNRQQQFGQRSITDIENLQNAQSNMANRTNGIVNQISNGISSSLNRISNAFENTKKSISNSVVNSLGLEIPEKTNGQNNKSDYLPDVSILKSLSFELSKYVKSIDKPSVTYNVKEYNQYNRKKLCYGGIPKYSPIKVSFYDTKNNPVQRFFFSYLKMIDNSFFCKSSEQFKHISHTNDWDNNFDDWGFDTDSNFRLIDSISIVEIFMDKMMVYTLENPVIDNISFGSNTVGDYSPNEINVSFQYEGITNDLLVGEYSLPLSPYTNKFTDSNDVGYLKGMIGRDINKDIATFVQKRYKDGSSYAVDTAMAFIKGLMDAPKGEKWSVFKSQLLDTGRSLGFADEINATQKVVSIVDNFKDAENKAQYVIKVSDDPTSVLGELTTNGITSSDSSVGGLF